MVIMQQSYKDFSINGYKAVLRFDTMGYIESVDFAIEVSDNQKDIFRKHCLGLKF